MHGYYWTLLINEIAQFRDLQFKNLINIIMNQSDFSNFKL